MAAGALHFPGRSLSNTFRPPGFADRICQREQVILRRTERGWIGRKPQHVPTPRRRHSARMHLTEVIAVWFCVRGKRTEDGGLIGVHIGERGNRGLGAGGARTATDKTHLTRISGIASISS